MMMTLHQDSKQVSVLNIIGIIIILIFIFYTH